MQGLVHQNKFVMNKEPLYVLHEDKVVFTRIVKANKWPVVVKLPFLGHWQWPKLVIMTHILYELGFNKSISQFVISSKQADHNIDVSFNRTDIIHFTPWSLFEESRIIKLKACSFMPTRYPRGTIRYWQFFIGLRLSWGRGGGGVWIMWYNTLWSLGQRCIKDNWLWW